MARGSTEARLLSSGIVSWACPFSSDGRGKYTYLENGAKALSVAPRTSGKNGTGFAGMVMGDNAAIGASAEGLIEQVPKHDFLDPSGVDRAVR